MTAEIFSINESMAECSDCGSYDKWIIHLDRECSITRFECSECGGMWELDFDRHF